MNKSTAKRSAAFDTCIMLRKHELIDDHFNSAYHRRLPAMRNAKLAITCKKTNQYDMLLKPSLWASGRGTLVDTFHATVITFKPTQPLARELVNLVLLSREELTTMPQFPIFLEEDDIETMVHCIPLEKTCAISVEQVGSLTEFTLRVFRDVFQKTYSCESANMPYWLAPTNVQSAPASDIDSAEYIDWDTVHLVNNNDELDFPEDVAPSTLCDRFVFDPWDGRCRFFTLEIDQSLKPSDPPPDFVPRRRCMDSIMNYCISLSKNSRAKFLAKCNWDQPVLRAELVRLRRNMLDKMTDPEKEIATKCYICLEPLRVSAVSH
jgi:endoribonuclease Dicer